LANRTNPDDPLPLYSFFRSFVDQGVNPPDIAIQGLARAFTLAPENITVRVSHAFALANKGEFDEAIRLGQTVAFDPHDNGEGQRLLNQLERMRDRAAGKEDEDAESEKTSAPAG
jgi:predicted Zn-dependent protease